MPRYILADSAKREIDEILSVIVGADEEAAWGWYTKLHDKFATLADSPRIGRVRGDLLPDSLMFPFGNYLIFYDIIPDGIQIIHVTHGKRDVPQVFGGTSGKSENH